MERGVWSIMSDRERKAEQLRKDLLDEDNYNRPTICPECGGIMIFRGVGEYKCEDCGSLGYDDYGKVSEIHSGYGKRVPSGDCTQFQCFPAL